MHRHRWRGDKGEVLGGLTDIPGIRVGKATVPIVPSAIIFDLCIGDPGIRPTASMGYAACEQATAEPVAEGSIGAGTGATVGKAYGIEWAMKGGVGTASQTFPVGVVVAALLSSIAGGMWSGTARSSLGPELHGVDSPVRRICFVGGSSCK
jgi:L-aminopeptidase/D-esterase-like protein